MAANGQYADNAKVIALEAFIPTEALPGT